VRIAMIGPFGLAPRGTMRVRALPLARALAAQGHAVTLLMPPWHTPAEPARAWEEAGVHLEYVALTPRLPGLQQLLVSARLLRRALAWRPDVIHCFKPIGYAVLVAWFARALRRWGRFRGRIVMDADDWEGEGGWNALTPRSWWLRILIARQERWGLTHADAVTVASRTLQSLVWSLGVPAERVAYLPNGCDTPAKGNGARARERYGLGAAPVVLLYTRFFEFQVARPLEVFRGILAQQPAARLLVVGAALYPEHDDRFDRLVCEWDLTERVVRTGWLPMEALPDVFAAADVALFPFDDTLVNRTKCAVKLVDLLAAGVPVVAEVGQNAEYIVNGESGVLVPCGDVEAMSAAALAILAAGRPGPLGEGAARRMRERFAWSLLAQQASAVYRG